MKCKADNQRFFLEEKGENTIWLVSYPRSGSTWLRFLLAHVLYPEKDDVSWRELEKLVPDVAQRSVKEAKVVKSHLDYDERYKRVVYLYRDGRDVAVSYFYYLQGGWIKPELRVDCSWHEFFGRFVKGDVPDGSWKGHVYLWTGLPHGITTLLVSYERMLKDSVSILKEVCNFAEVQVTNEICGRAVKRACFAEIIKKGKRDGQHPYSRGLRGTSGGWKDVFTPDQAERFWSWAGDVLTSLNYSKEG